MWPDPKWLDILKASSWQFFCLSIGCVALLFGDARGLVAFGPLLKNGIVIAAVLFACLWVASVGESIKALIGVGAGKAMTSLARWKEARKFGRYIPYMTHEERAIFAQLLHENRKSFTGAVDGGLAATLLGRGYIRVRAVKGQTISYEDVPFAVPDHIWAVAEARKADFPYKPDPDGADAWRECWKTRI